MEAIRSHKTVQTPGVYKTHLFKEADTLAKPGSVTWWRINIILTKAYQKTWHYKYRTEEGEKPSGYIYFSRKESIHLGGKNYSALFKRIENAGILASYGLKNYKNKTQNIRTYQFLTIQPLSYSCALRSKNVTNSLDSYYDAKQKGIHPVVANKLIPCLRKISIDITEEQFFSAVMDHYEEYKQKCILKRNIPLPEDKYRESYDPLWYEIVSFNEASGKEIYQFISVDSFSGRVHTIITRLPKFIRELGVIRYKGIALAELDMKTFQPLLFALMLEGTDFARWFFFVEDCYEEIRKKFKQPSRDIAKQYMYKWMFGQATSRMHKEFCKTFPEAGAKLTRIKTELNLNNPNSFKYSKNNKKIPNFHSNASFLMQKKEVELMMHVWGELGKKQIPFATIHDAVLVPEDRLDEAEKLMYEVMDKHLKAAKGRIRIKRTVYTRKHAAA